MVVREDQQLEVDDFETTRWEIDKLVQPLHGVTFSEWIGVISDLVHKYVEVDQVYKDKAILKSFMEQYVIANRLQFKTDRSNAIKYVCYVYANLFK